MNPRTLIPMLLAMLLLAACNALRPSVETDDIELRSEILPGADPARYRTWTWAGALSMVRDPEGNWKPVGFDLDDEVRRLVEAEMAARGLVRDPLNAELKVGYIIGVDMVHLEPVPERPGEPGVLRNIPKGALAIVTKDARTDRPVWVGAAVGNVRSGRSDDEVRARLAYAIHRLFEAFLPRSREKGDGMTNR